jgi:hypothetical protein
VQKLEMTQTDNRRYQEKLEALIKEGEELMQNVEDRRLYDELKTHIDKLKVKLFKAKIDNEGIHI